MKKLLLILIILLFVRYNICAQPYIYKITYNDTIPGYGYSVYQYDFQNKSLHLVADSLYINDYTWDNTGNWVLVDQPRDNTVLINYSENKRYNLDGSILSLGALLYSKIYNKLYVFYDYDDEEGLTRLLSFSLENETTLYPLELNTSEFIENMYNREAFLSEDERLIYFASENTNYTQFEPHRYRMKYFSTITNNIIRERELAEIGYSGSFSYTLNKGRKGISVITSYYKNQDGKVDNYFNVYNFDKDTGYAFIKSFDWSVPYFTHNGKYLILSRVYYDSTQYDVYNKGIFDVFDAQTGAFIKTINYPPKGNIFTYDDYPTQSYYFLQDSTQATSFIINIDEIVNPGLKVKLINSHGSKLPGGGLQYYEGGWKNAADNGDGTFSLDTQLKTVSLRMTYGYASQTKSNIPVGSDTVVFQTVNTAVKLLDSRGTPLDTGTVQYYAGGWRSLGTTLNGLVTKEMLPANLTFRINYNGTQQDKTQNLLNNNIVEFTVGQ